MVAFTAKNALHALPSCWKHEAVRHVTILSFCLLWIVSCEVLLLPASFRDRTLPVGIVSSASRRNDHVSAGRRQRERSPSIRRHNNKSRLLFHRHHRSLLPQWIANYFAWHRQARKIHPDSRILYDEDSPGVLIRFCIRSCGGLNDRLGNVLSDLFFANQTQRVLLYHWRRPMELERFLEPNLIDWRLPNLSNATLRFKHYQKIESETSSFSYADAVRRANTEYKKEKILITSHLGHFYKDEYRLMDELKRLGETDMLHHTHSFGMIFHSLFQPVPSLQQQLRRIQSNLGLIPKQYSAVHCRVRHPSNFRDFNHSAKMGEGLYFPDKSGLAFHGEGKEMAVSIAIHAIDCTPRVVASGKTSSHEPIIYFYADEEELVQYMTNDIAQKSPLDEAASKAVEGIRLVARPLDDQTLHIDKQDGKTHDAKAYFGTFLDLYLAADARCISYGIGNFGYLASKIAGPTGCHVRHQAMKDKRFPGFPESRVCIIG